MVQNIFAPQVATCCAQSVDGSRRRRGTSVAWKRVAGLYILARFSNRPTPEAVDPDAVCLVARRHLGDFAGHAALRAVGRRGRIRQPLLSEQDRPPPLG